jgi:hypothetical protein
MGCDRLLQAEAGIGNPRKVSWAATQVLGIYPTVASFAA